MGFEICATHISPSPLLPSPIPNCGEATLHVVGYSRRHRVSDGVAQLRDHGGEEEGLSFGVGFISLGSGAGAGWGVKATGIEGDAQLRGMMHNQEKIEGARISKLVQPRRMYMEFHVQVRKLLPSSFHKLNCKTSSLGRYQQNGYL